MVNNDKKQVPSPRLSPRSGNARHLREINPLKVALDSTRRSDSQGIKEYIKIGDIGSLFNDLLNKYLFNTSVYNKNKDKIKKEENWRGNLAGSVSGLYHS